MQVELARQLVNLVQTQLQLSLAPLVYCLKACETTLGLVCF
jgi:hypothetical protein